MWIFLSGMAVGIILTLVVCFIFTALIGKSVEEFYEEDDDKKY